MRLLLILALSPGLFAQAVDEVLDRYFAAEKANDERAAQYTFTEVDTHFEYDKAGVAKRTTSQTYDVIFVEGDTYKKLTARNGQPLSAKDRAKEEKKIQDVAKERRKQRRSGLFSRNVSLSGDDEKSTTLFSRRLLGEEDLGGRKAWVVELTPRADRKPANDLEKDALSFRRKIWIDQAEGVPLRWESHAVGDMIFLKPGSTITIEFVKINNDAWLASSMVVEMRAQIMKFVKVNGRDEIRNSNFQKFDVQSTITVEPAAP